MEGTELSEKSDQFSIVNPYVQVKRKSKTPLPSKPPKKEPEDQGNQNSEFKDIKELQTSAEVKPVVISGDSPSEKTKSPINRFKGRNAIQYGIWAHYLAYASSICSFFLGIVALLWLHPSTYGCEINGQPINPIYLPPEPIIPGQPIKCNATYFNLETNELHHICCVPHTHSTLEGNLPLGALLLIYGILMFFYENVDWGFGLWFPNDSFFYNKRLNLIGILHILVGITTLGSYVTCLAGSFILTTGVVYCYAGYRQECGDGGRETRRKEAEKKQVQAAKEKEKLLKLKEQNLTSESTTTSESKSILSEFCRSVYQWSPFGFLQRIYNEDKLSPYTWIGIYFIINLILFFYTLHVWLLIAGAEVSGLLEGNLLIDCDDLMCHVNRKMIRFGPLSGWAPWAKACGNCLNMNSAILLLPVIKLLLNKLNNAGVSFTNTQHNSDYFGKFFARPFTRYVPLQYNIEFHKIVAMMVGFYTILHTIFHYLNLISANAITIRVFRLWGWEGTNYLTGAICLYAMFIIFTATPQIIKSTKFEIFFYAHHWFVVYYLFLFLHGPNFIYWGILPVCLYALERFLQTKRGNRPFSTVKVEWISPVMAIYFRPVFKEDFQFKEGQYLYLNCPHISQNEWHPFTISSAMDDMNNGPRIHLETGEEVVEIPRPANLPPKAKWGKYCVASKDWKTLSPEEYLEKSETGYSDFISVHIKVHGLDDPVAKTWTRRLKEYFELLSPTQKFPFYFSHRDPRGEITIGRITGPDGLPILRVDGPHSAPSEHYTNYGTVMIIGAGIGLTPCASILCALTKYRWKKNFPPEILHFYWVVRQSEVDSFQWLVHMLTDLSYELKKSKEIGQVEKKYYCEINIYITGVERKSDSERGTSLGKGTTPLFRPSKQRLPHPTCDPTFTPEQLYDLMLNPPVESKGQVKKMKNQSENRLQDIWVWNGRPHWDEIFAEMKEQRQHSDIGVCFCGTPVIGSDLRTMCEKYSSVEEDILFSLHKENF